MKNIFPQAIVSRRASLLSLAGCLALSMSLSNCGEEEKSDNAQPTPPAPAPAPAASPEPQVEAATSQTEPAAKPAMTQEEAKKQLDAVFYNQVQDLINSTAASPSIRDTAVLLLEKLENYYATLQSEPVSIKRVELAVDIASFQRELGAWERSFASYELALKDWESLSMKEKTSIEVQRLKSSIYNGLAATLLYLPISQGDSDAVIKQREQSLGYFKEQLDNDLSIFTAVGPKEGDPVPQGNWDPEVNRATSDLISSYRCVGDGMRYNEQFADARKAYTEGIKIAQRVQKLSDEPSLQLVKILSALGDLESKLGNKKDALSQWSTAAQIAAQINKQSGSYRVKIETKQIVDRLTPVARRLQAELANEAAQSGQEPPAETPAQ